MGESPKRAVRSLKPRKIVARSRRVNQTESGSQRGLERGREAKSERENDTSREKEREGKAGWPTGNTRHVETGCARPAR